MNQINNSNINAEEALMKKIAETIQIKVVDEVDEIDSTKNIQILNKLQWTIQQKMMTLFLSLPIQFLLKTIILRPLQF